MAVAEPSATGFKTTLEETSFHLFNITVSGTMDVFKSFFSNMPDSINTIVPSTTGTGAMCGAIRELG